ncbi:uncharacterized protein LOC118827793 [Colossoma macropomum]|uniref:uncharacterized protein LOC118827793 n=1 Tax=Colossoma macropomum TaxID=42526 RepID=UPI0018654EBB|nr:uncharacterized protein LOC118827793 [Colossoma macropomum]
MVWTGVLRAVLLLSLPSSGISNTETRKPIDLTALKHIVSVINVHANKDPASRSSGSSSSSGSPSVTQSNRREDFQYAMAVRIAKNQCLQGFNEQGLEPLKTEVSNFKNNPETRDVYEGQMVIAARSKNERHSEYKLLIENERKVIKQLLESKQGRNDEDCVIFYTYNSPCLKRCLNEEADKKTRKIHDKQTTKGKKLTGIFRCIYNYLDELNSLQGPRAFVFSQIYREDVDKEELSDCFRKIADQIPLYQCDNNNRCRHCGQDNEYCAGAGADLAG